MRRALIIVNLVLFALCAYATPVTIYPGLTLEESSGRYYVHFEMPDYDIVIDTFHVGNHDTPLQTTQFAHESLDYYFSRIQPKEYDYFEYLSYDGRPELPFYSLNLLLPLDGTDFSVIDAQIISTETIEMPFDYTPAQAEYYSDDDFSYDASYYITYDDTWYWDDYAFETIEYCKIKGINFSIFPCHYEPSSKELTIVTEATFEISYDGSPLDYSYLDYILFTERSVYYFFDNYVGYPAPYPFINDEYLIISADQWENDAALIDFIDHKESLGYNVTLATLHEIGYTAAEIRAYIQDQYRNNGVKFVLLVGDVSELPFSCGTAGSMADPPSDVFYACLSKDDMWNQWKDLSPSVFLGRWPVVNNTELRHIVDKTIASDLYLGEYEPNKINIFAGNGAHKTYNYTTCQYIYNHTIQTQSYYTGNLVDGRYMSDSIAWLTLRNQLEDNEPPTWMFVYVGHGSVVGTAGPYYFTTGRIGLIQTSDLYYQPFGFAFSCSIGDIYNSSNFARDWITSTEGGVSFLASTTISNATCDKYYSRKIFNQLDGQPDITLGEFIGNARAKYYNSDKVIWRLREAKKYVLYGDPSLYLFGINIHFNQPFNGRSSFRQLVDGETIPENTIVQIYSVAGHLVRICNSQELDLQGLSPGVYTIVYTLENNKISKKIVLQ